MRLIAKAVLRALCGPVFVACAATIIVPPMALAQTQQEMTPQQRYDTVIALTQQGETAQALVELDILIGQMPLPENTTFPYRGWQDLHLTKALLLQRDGQCGRAISHVQSNSIPMHMARTLRVQAECNEALADWLSAQSRWESLADFLGIDSVNADPGAQAHARLQQAYARSRWSPADHAQLEALALADTALKEMEEAGTLTDVDRRTRFKIDLRFGRTWRARAGLEGLLITAEPAMQVALFTDLARIDAQLGNWSSVAEFATLGQGVGAALNAPTTELDAYAALAAAHLNGLKSQEAEIAATLEAFVSTSMQNATSVARTMQILVHLFPLITTSGDLDWLAPQVETVEVAAFRHDDLMLTATYQARVRLALAYVELGGEEQLDRATALLERPPEMMFLDPAPEILLEEFRAAIALRRARGIPDGQDDFLNGGGQSVHALHMIMGRIAQEDLDQTPTQLSAVSRAQRIAYRAVFEDAVSSVHAQLSSKLPFTLMGEIFVPHSGDLEVEGGSYGVSDLDRERLDEAFRFAQASRLTEAGRAMIATLARLAVGDDALGSLLRARDALLEERVLVANARSGEGVGERARIDAALAEIDDQLAAQNPEFERLLQPTALSIAEVRGALAPREAVLKQIVTEDALISFLVTEAGITLSRVPVDRADLAKMIETLRAGLDPSAPARSALRAAAALEPQASPGVAGPLFRADVARSLYDMILAPHRTRLAGVEVVHVVADGPLMSIPYSMLLSDWDGAEITTYADYAGLDWAIRERAFATLPILSALTLNRASQVGGGFVGVGDPVLTGQGDPVTLDRAAGFVDPAAIRALVPLPETALELRQLNDLIADGTGALYLASDAVEPVLTGGALSDAGVIAFATHGLLRGELRGLQEPALVLTPPDVAGASDDGLLSASEIARLSLAADWVVLSACNTAGGEGEGLSGLARAFLYAGARGVLASHWPLQSDAAVALTTEHFAALDQGSGARALRASILDMLERPRRQSWQHPAAWAPFVVIGGAG